MTTDFTSLLAFYETQLFKNILPFWMTRALDPDRGGYYTCFTNRGNRLLHTHKFTWSQGRFVWTLSRLARGFQHRRPQGEIDAFIEHAAHGAKFLMQYARLPNGNCAFILSEDGRPILLDEDGAARPAGSGEAYDTSVTADLFVVYGLAEYAIAADDAEAYRFADDLYQSARDRMLDPPYRSDPYPVPPGYEAHGRPMILLETAHQLALSAEHFGDGRARGFMQEAGRFMEEILDRFRDPGTNLITEMYSEDPRKRATMLGSYVNPGHMLECAWFICHLAQRLGMDARISQAVDVMRAACRVGWDGEHGGFFQFVDRSGGPPAGPVPPELEDAEMTSKLRNNWDNKLWWPHSEALYALLLGYELSRDADLLDRYWQVHEYTFSTFPDAEIGEWIQIRARDGTPVDKVVALPVKDPFHITRAFILCIDVLRRLTARGDCPTVS